MGSCASVHKGTPESAMKLGVSFGSKKDNLVIPESPIKDKHVNDHTPIKTFDDHGSKDETFFDSRAWLDSDCEDDFFSVNGDFTPSRGNTPVHHNFSMGTPKINKTTLEGRPPTPGSIPEPSPTGKKRLSELFRESLREEQEADKLDSSRMQNIGNGKTEVKQTILDVLPKSASGTPYISGANSVCSSERTANGDALIEREKSIKSAQCCLPSLISCRSFSDRKKKMSPAIAVNDKA
ncbi:uncharacterized protein At3g27210 [Ricinus communis]|uniref:Uncharacterized protein n=1 Tax=Ricinus communis TaxID=3988 RepID=B9RBK4_RICCO|nr:uncharacterized protein At3g27210 [Ricinus communis]EEF50925.1 conserved hypothetical protein [Ricinus communis]|eukprot:XP_002509538.1 uncharacterized protein At3g27210 [Ricinus communis]